VRCTSPWIPRHHMRNRQLSVPNTDVMTI